MRSPRRLLTHRSPLWFSSSRVAIQAVAALLGLVVATAPPGASAGASEAEIATASAASERWAAPRIVNGSLTTAHEAVGALLARVGPGEYEMICSGTLIGCRTFLTAQHCFCLEDGSECPGGQPPPADGFRVFLQHAGFFDVASIQIHPRYDFPVGDVALAELTEPVTGIRPVGLGDHALPAGTVGAIVGFGETRGGNGQLGVKRSGSVSVASCVGIAPLGQAVCWRYHGEGANTCNGDSGGPLLADLGDGSRIYGVTSGGLQTSCLADDSSFDASVPAHREWIVDAMGGDAHEPTAACGDLAVIGGGETRIQAHEEIVAPLPGLPGGSESPEVLRTSIEVAPGIRELRVGVDSIDDGGSQLELALESAPSPAASPGPLGASSQRSAATSAGALHTPVCESSGPGAFAFCRVREPAAGSWTARVFGRAQPGPLQLVATLLPAVGPTDPPDEDLCGNASLDSGERCDGSADAACPGRCLGDCTCRSDTDPDPGACIDGAVELRRLTASRAFTSFSLQALLREPAGSLDSFDPSHQAFDLTLGDAATSIELRVPAGDPGWVRLGAGGSGSGGSGGASQKGGLRSRWIWRPSSSRTIGEPTFNALSLTGFGNAGGPVVFTASGRVPPGRATPSRRNLQARVEIGSLCLR